MTAADTTTVTAVYRHEPDIRLRPLPEWAGALVYTPDSPALSYLNTTSWAVLELCDGLTAAELEEVFLDFVGTEVSPEEARTRLAEALSMLTAQHVIRVDDAGSPASP
jgi:hypothetical protein